MRSAICLCSTFVFLVVLIAIAQPSNSILNEYRQAEHLYNLDNPTDETDRKALQLYLKAATELVKSDKYDSIVFDAFLKAGILQQSLNQQREAIVSFARANDVQERILPDSLRFKPYLFIGSAYYSLNNFDSAAYYFKAAEQLANKYPGISELERLYNKTGTMYYETGNYVQSQFYFEKALSTLYTNSAASQYLLVNYKNNIASALRKLHEYPKALAIYESLLPFGIEKNGLLHNIGDTYLAMGDYNKAISYLSATSYSNSKKSNDLAYAYLRLKLADSAAFHLNAALKFGSSGKSVTRGITLSYWGDLCAMQNKPSLALHYFQEAIMQMDPDFNDTHNSANPTQFEGFHSFSNLFETLTHKANAFSLLFDSTKNLQYLVDAANTMKSAFMLSNIAAETYGSDEARLFLNENLQPAYQSYVEWCIHLHVLSPASGWLKEAIVMAEKSKAAVLHSSLLQLPLLNIKGIPHDLLQEENNLKASINRDNLLLSTLTDSIQLKTVNQQIIDLEIELSKVHEKLNAQPAYASLWKTANINLDKLKGGLNSNEVIYSFYFGQSILFGFVITKDTIFYRNLHESVPLLQQSRIFTNEIKEVSADPKRLKTFQQDLYKELIEPVLPLIQKKNRLIIIPHNELAFLPFEVLEDNKDRLLLESYSISYNYSLAFMQQQSPKGNELLAAFAPFANDRNNSSQFQAIPASRKEVSSLNGRIFFDSLATKQQFLQLSSQIGIAHLATHAAANDSIPLQSFIAFYPQGNDTSYKLFEPDIYDLDMHASRLVVLSACETGAGKLVHGEGLLSLSRAFSYAGCPSIITSLWKADDESTAYICQQLHHYLAKGMKKNDALQKAKLDYLKNENFSPQFKTPRYWANLVLVGDNSAVHSQKASILNWIIVLGLVSLVVLFLLYIYKKRKAG